MGAAGLREEACEVVELVADGDVVGCGIDFRRGIVFWALNGATFKEAEQPLRLDTSWCATVAATGEAEVAFNFGAKQPFAFDVLGLEERIWKDWRSDFSLRELFESCTPPELLDADERRRGWPWNQNDEWSATLDAWVRPWLQREAARAGGGGGGGCVSRQVARPALAPRRPSGRRTCSHRSRSGQRPTRSR